MKLEAQLTTGWTDDPQHPLAADRLHAQAQAAEDYTMGLQAQLHGHSGPLDILGVDQLFRKNVHAFQPIKRFIGALSSLPPHPDLGPIRCHLDVFAYTFLKGAKNMDLLLPLADPLSPAFTATYERWCTTMDALGDLERLGDPLPPAIKDLNASYLGLRHIVTRPSAQDERRALVSLLVSGPSTLAQISSDLGLNYTLGQRTLGVYTAIGIVSQRPNSDQFIINEATIPLVVFCIREILGLDLLSLLPPLL